ncbi:unnamed protein product [Rangifer tarandus platyrhynchus]|uniref:Uncharacterized protein n=1 Tax=Rangifer tarandus platyrhynchus TaxID=3082113 RepID=A0AC59Z2Z1_RANTA
MVSERSETMSVCLWKSRPRPGQKSTLYSVRLGSVVPRDPRQRPQLAGPWGIPQGTRLISLLLPGGQAQSSMDREYRERKRTGSSDLKGNSEHENRNSQQSPPKVWLRTCRDSPGLAAVAVPKPGSGRKLENPNVDERLECLQSSQELDSKRKKNRATFFSIEREDTYHKLGAVGVKARPEAHAVSLPSSSPPGPCQLPLPSCVQPDEFGIQNLRLCRVEQCTLCPEQHVGVGGCSRIQYMSLDATKPGVLMLRGLNKNYNGVSHAGSADTEDVWSLTEVLRSARPFGGWRPLVPPPHGSSHVTPPSQPRCQTEAAPGGGGAWRRRSLAEAVPGGGGAWRRLRLAASWDPGRTLRHGPRCAPVGSVSCCRQVKGLQLPREKRALHLLVPKASLPPACK